MGTGFKLSPLPAFQPGETVLHFERRIRLLSCKSFPTYRLFFSLPPLTEAALYVTDRRVVLMANALRLLCQQFSIWFGSSATGENPELLKSVSTGKGRWSGQYLELISEHSQKHWCRSRELRLRFFMRNPGALQRLVTGTAGREQ